MKIKKNRVLLITPRPTLGLIAVGSALKRNRNINVDIVVLTRSKGELASEETKPEEAAEILKEHLGKDLLWAGITVFSSYIRIAQAVSKIIKEFDKNTPVVWGGIHPTLYPKQPLESSYVDVSVFGDGEETACELVDVFLKGKKINKVKGIAYKKNGQKIKTSPREYTDLTKVGTQDYSLVRNQEVLMEQKYCFGKIIAIHVANGCPFNCSFCINSSMKRNHIRKSPQQIIEQIEYLIKKFHIKEIDFIDELFLVNKKWIEEFADLLAKKDFKIVWRANGHAHTLANKKMYPDSFFKNLKKLGLKMTTMGAESGSQLQLNVMNKMTSPEQILEAVRRIKKLKLFCGMTYLMGTPHEEEKDMLKTINHIREIHEISSEYPYLAFQIYRPYPGNPMYEAALRAGYVGPKNLKDWAESTDFGSGGLKNWQKYPWINEYKKKLINHAITLSVYFNKTLNKKWFVPWVPKTYPYDNPIKKTLRWPSLSTYPISLIFLLKKTDKIFPQFPFVRKNIKNILLKTPFFDFTRNLKRKTDRLKAKTKN